MEIVSSVFSLVSSPWVWLILIASLMYAAGNYIDELLFSKYEQEVGTMVLISTLFGGVVVAVFYTLAWYYDVSIILDQPVIFQALAVGVLEALWVIPYLYATERSGAIVAGPLFQAVPVFALAMEATLGVIPPMIQIIGAGIIVVGGILVAIESEDDEEGNVSHTVDWITIGMMSISAILVSLIYVLFRDAALATNFIGVGFWVGLGSLLTGITIYAVWKPYRENFNTFCKSADYKAVGIQFFNEMLDSGGVYLTNLATTLGPSVMIVTAFNATQPIFVGLIAGLLSFWGITSMSTSRTESGAWKIIALGILLIALGIIVISLGI